MARCRERAHADALRPARVSFGRVRSLAISAAKYPSFRWTVLALNACKLCGWTCYGGRSARRHWASPCAVLGTIIHLEILLAR